MPDSRVCFNQLPLPKVSLIEASGLLPRSKYYSVIVPDARSEREIWSKDLLDSVSGVDLVFIDPDNGIEISSKPVGRNGSSKYVTWEEIHEIWKAGCSLLIYQHFPRKPRAAFIDKTLADARRVTGSSFVQAFRTAQVLFLLIGQPRHETWLRRVAATVPPRWRGQIELPLAINDTQPGSTGSAG